MKLLKKLLIRVIALIIVVCVVIGGMGIYKSHTETRKLMMQKVDDQLELRTMLVEEKLASTKRLIATLASNPQILRVMESGRSDSNIENQLTDLLEANNDLMTLVSLVNTKDIIFTSDKVNGLTTTDISDRAYLQEAKDTKKLAVSEVITNKTNGTQGIAICLPVYVNNKYVGSILTFVKFSLVTDLVKDTKVGENGYAYIVDNKGDDRGTLVYHPVTELVEKKFNLYADGNKELNAFLDKMKTENTASGKYVKDGNTRNVKFMNFENWSLVIIIDEDDLNATSTAIRNMTIIAVIIAIFLAMFIGYFVINSSIVKPIRILQKSMAKAGNGDLTELVNIKTKDEIEELALSYNQMIENQRNTLTSISNISQTMTSSAEELTASSEEVNASSEEVSQNINDMMKNILSEEEMMKSVEREMNKLNGSIEVSSELTNKSQGVCMSALDVAEEGRSGVKSSVNSMADISTSTTVIIESFSELNVQAKKVTGISETIKGIAEQINLLALNASIEAARAGDAGRGFTVVAEEVRKLAEQTTQESGNIHLLLNDITALINKADVNVNKAKEHVDEGEGTIRSLDGKFMNIIETFESLNNYIGDLETISKEQVIISDEIMGSVEASSKNAIENSGMAQEISASAEEQTSITETVSQAAEDSAQMAMELNGLIQQFKL